MRERVRKGGWGGNTLIALRLLGELGEVDRVFIAHIDDRTCWGNSSSAKPLGKIHHLPAGWDVGSGDRDYRVSSRPDHPQLTLLLTPSMPHPG